MIEGRKCWIGGRGREDCFAADIHDITDIVSDYEPEEGRFFTLAELAERDKAMMVEGAKMALLRHTWLRDEPNTDEVARRIVEGE